MRSGQEKRILQAFGQNVRRSRQELSLSQEKLAEYAGIHRTYVADIERGTRNVGLVNIVKIARALNIAPAQLLDL